MKSVTVVIVNYDVANEVNECLISIQDHLNNLSIEIIVVDNNSPDRSIENLASKFPGVKFIFLNENIGYSKANNIAAGESKSDYLLILNPDTILSEDFITPIINFIESGEKVGVCGPMLLYGDKTYQNSSGYSLGLLYESAEALMFINLYRKILKYLNRKKFQKGIPFKIGWVSGACLLIKRSIFEDAGGFNPEYFLNYEDIDLCEKIKELGYSNYYFPYLSCIHLDQTSQKRNYENFVYSRYVSRLIYSKKHYKSIKRFLVRFIHLNGLLLRMLFVNFLYSGTEKIERKRGYKKGLFLYLGLNK